MRVLKSITVILIAIVIAISIPMQAYACGATPCSPIFYTGQDTVRMESTAAGHVYTPVAIYVCNACLTYSFVKNGTPYVLPHNSVITDRGHCISSDPSLHYYTYKCSDCGYSLGDRTVKCNCHLIMSEPRSAN